MQNNINICFIMGKIASDIEFKFIYNSKNHISRVKFWVETYKSKILIKGYDEIADIIYKNYKKNNFINFRGFIEKNEVIIKEIEYENIDFVKKY